MKKLYVALLLILAIIIVLSGCGKNDVSDDLYVGEYISLDEELEGSMKIIKEEEYHICIEFEGVAEILAVGEVLNGTLFYEGEDNYGNKISGNIEEYGKDYPVRVEFNGKNLFDEIEFERK